MKIFVLGTRGFPNVQGGVEKHCEELFPRIAKENSVLAFSRTPYFDKDKKLSRWKNIQFKYLWCPKNKSFEAILHTFLGVISARLNSPDVLHIHAVGPALLIPLARLLGLKVVFTHHGPDYEREKWGKLAKIILQMGEYLGVKFSNRTIVISNVIKNSIKEKYNKTNLSLIPNGVTKPELIQPNNVLKRFSLEPKKYIFTACRFVPEKGLTDLIYAYKSINNPNFKLVIAGDADHETVYSKSLKKLAAENDIVLTGFLAGKNLGELFSNAGLFVLPSYYEGLPIALLEALSYKLPVLISDIPQHKEINLPAFRYFKTGDVKELGCKIAELFNLGITNEEIQKYEEWISEKYNWDVIALETLKVYREVLE